MVRDEIASHHELVERVEDIYSSLKRFENWDPEILAVAIDLLVARGEDGGITETADGRLVAHPRRTQPC